MPTKWIWFLVISLCVTAMLLGALVSEMMRTEDTPPVEEPPGRAYRIIGVWQDRVAVFEPQTDTPERVYEARVSALPDEEQQKLREGIAVYDGKALAQTLEDYI
ncbi:MAG: hypothetical protein E7553_06435 [Ruminococcaceae bacterium]|nr:hypothetical protein [Oscillospiraceae bacterium]